ncbi:recombinase family protein [Streptomyces sp. NBC_01622]|uniref:recombinase family protein n=1 Tax=Streptomyces sp. NBC_01622 TaxID=2975903 RepID=UPI0038658E81|nr:recombinase family protein [Streptomyces sp. NBC_01622]
MTITTIATLTGREYLRVSVDNSGFEQSNNDQHDDNADVAADFGITLGDGYSDVGSGSRLAWKPRGDFLRLMADLRSGDFGADILQMWENSRGSRQPREWLDLIDVCRARGVKILITTHRRIFDPDNWRDRQELQKESLAAEAYSEETRERVERALKRNGEKGKPHGAIPYGFDRSYVKVHNSKGRVVTRPDKQFSKPSEALHVIDLFVQLKAGTSFGAIERDWAERGIVSKDGIPFSAQSLSQMARKISYVAKRVRTRTTRDENGKRKNIALGEVDAVWPVIADFEGSPMSAEEFVTLFYDVQAMLKDPDRRTNPGGGAKHVWTGAVRCDVCSGPITVTAHLSKEGEQVYACRDKGCIRLSQKPALDDLLTSHVLGLLADPDVYARLGSGNDGDDTELRTVRAELRLKRADLKSTQETEGESDAHERRLARKEERLETEITDLEQREAELTKPNPLEELFPAGPAETVAARWEATEITAKRAIAALILSPKIMGEVRIKRVVDSASDAVADRITWRTKD